MDAVETFEVGGLTVKIVQDDDPMNPRTDFDNFGHMVCFHSRYNLGDKHKFSSPDEFRESEEYKEAAVILPLYLYDHSGITMRTGSAQFQACDSMGWDWGQVGWIYVSREDVLKNFPIDNGSPCVSEKGITYKRTPIPRKRITPAIIKRATQCLEGEVETYDQYLTGDVYGYVIEDEDGEHVDSCWGFYGEKYCREEAESTAKWQVKYRAEEDKKVAEVMAL